MAPGLPFYDRGRAHIATPEGFCPVGGEVDDDGDDEDDHFVFGELESRVMESKAGRVTRSLQG